MLDRSKSTHYSTFDKSEDAISYQMKLKQGGSEMAAVLS